jgi:hypothetical protein
MMTKYREDMTDEELFQFIEEIEELHNAYDDCYRQEKNYHDSCEPKWEEEEIDGDIILRKAALNSKGQP